MRQHTPLPGDGLDREADPLATLADLLRGEPGHRNPRVGEQLHEAPRDSRLADPRSPPKQQPHHHDSDDIPVRGACQSRAAACAKGLR
jgi:hypothetical protein